MKVFAEGGAPYVAYGSDTVIATYGPAYGQSTVQAPQYTEIYRNTPQHTVKHRTDTAKAPYAVQATYRHR